MNSGMGDTAVGEDLHVILKSNSDDEHPNPIADLTHLSSSTFSSLRRMLSVGLRYTDFYC